MNRIILLCACILFFFSARSQRIYTDCKENLNYKEILKNDFGIDMMLESFECLKARSIALENEVLGMNELIAETDKPGNEKKLKKLEKKLSILNNEILLNRKTNEMLEKDSYKPVKYIEELQKQIKDGSMSFSNFENFLGHKKGMKVEDFEIIFGKSLTKPAISDDLIIHTFGSRNNGKYPLVIYSDENRYIKKAILNGRLGVEYLGKLNKPEILDDFIPALWGMTQNMGLKKFDESLNNDECCVDSGSSNCHPDGFHCKKYLERTIINTSSIQATLTHTSSTNYRIETITVFWK